MASARTLVSGGGGFAGRHLLEHLRREGVHVVAPDRNSVDFRDREAVRALVAEMAPASVFHLAALSSPSRSWQQPAEAILGNVEMSLNLLEAVRQEAPTATVVLVGSGQAYGQIKEPPATEDTPLRPDNPYAASKATSDLLGYQYWKGHGLRVVRLRPFNHAGPGQSPDYVVSSIARQIAAAEAKGEVCVLRTGDPGSRRDFTDVRDVVRAYQLASGLAPGAFNVCSGSAVSVSDLVEIASEAANVPVRHEVDPSLLRSGETPVAFGSAERLRTACGWSPAVPLDQTVRDTLEWWRQRHAE